ncbi:MAG TPA: HAMP domain-containing sensor histidine kinase [Solirubrobacteraceae bacterium]|nr:HAMP domain-containing sensor histidine kinase [Solirubrobacteraceae bacterium]
MEQGTSSEPRSGRTRTPLSRLPIRLRLAVSVGAVTFLMLAVFGTAVRTLTAHRLRSDLNSQVTTDAQNFANEIHISYVAGQLVVPVPDLTEFASVAGAAARVCTIDGSCRYASANAPYLGSPLNPLREINGYCVVTQRVPVDGVVGGYVLVQYGLPLASLNADIAQLDILLILGVLAGTAMAFGAGWLVAGRAITPIAELTAVASEIERTGDPTLMLPDPTADDEVAELSRTLSTMLASLADARGRTESALERQRAFVADASHELRTPLTSVLANLELLEDSLNGQDRELARSALRSTQRMRRLVADLLLLARSDVKQQSTPQPVDLAELVVAAAAELEPASEDHELVLDIHPAPILGNPDDLQRVAINLIENAIRHTPPGTHIRASTRTLRDGRAELVVADDGPGVAPEVKKHMFERFARGRGEASGSFGLGLAIVQAVTDAHDGTVEVKSTPRSGAQFTLRFPGRPPDAPESPAPAPPDAASTPVAH